MFTRLFVQNPIFTNVIAIIAVILGIVSLTRLPIALYPDITPPTIAVSASYPGADAETVAKTVGAPIELQVNGVETDVSEIEILGSGVLKYNQFASYGPLQVGLQAGTNTITWTVIGYSVPNVDYVELYKVTE